MAFASATSGRSGKRIDIYEFPGFVRSVPSAIVLFEFIATCDVRPSFFEHLRRSYGNACGFARLDLAQLPYPSSVVPHVVAALPTLLGNAPISAPAGWYLFLGGKVSSFVPWLSPGGDSSVLVIELTMIALGAGAAVAEQRGKNVLEVFDPLIQRHLASANEIAPVSLDPYDILGVPRSATRDEVARAYRKKRAEYTPDRVQGMAAELIELTHNRSVAINRAYDEIKKSRGW